AKALRLPQWIAFPGDQFRFVRVRKEYIDLRQQHFQTREVFAGTGSRYVQNCLRARLASSGQYRKQLLRMDLGHQKIPAEIKDAAACDAVQGDVRRAEFTVGSERMDEPAVLPGDVYNQGLARVSVGGNPDGRYVDAMCPQHISH